MDLRRKMALWICPELLVKTDDCPSYIIPTLADMYAGHLNHSRKTVSLRAAKRGGFVDELELGANITVNRAENIIQWFSDNWPEDLAWPKGITRPTPKKKEAA